MHPATAQGPPPNDAGPPMAATGQKDSAGSANGSTAESSQERFSNSPAHVAPAPSFSYALRPGNNVASPAPVFNMSQSVPVGVMPPVVPGFAPLSSPFSYMIPERAHNGPGEPLQRSSSSSSTVPQDISSSKQEVLPGPPPQTTGAPIQLMPNMGTPPPWPSGHQPFATPHVMLGPTGPLGPPGLGSAPLISSSNATPLVASDSSSSLRSNMAGGPVSSTPAVQQQVYSPYPSLPHIAANPQGLWFQPPQMSGIARPPFIQYPAVFPGPFPFPAHSISAQSVSRLDTQPPGVTPLGSTSGVPLSSGPSQVFVGNSNLQAQISTPVDSSKSSKDIKAKDGEAHAQLDAWTAHKTESGTVYYYNALTGESTYERPASFNKEPNDVALQPTPISREKVVGTDWEIVTMNDGRKYYYNHKTKLSSWQIPTEVSELRKKHEIVPSRENPVAMANASVHEDKESNPINLSAPALNTGGRDATSLRASSLPAPSFSSALDLVKKKLQESGAPGSSSPVPVLTGTTMLESNGVKSDQATDKMIQSENTVEKQKDAHGNGKISDSSSDSEDTDSGPSKEECIHQFKEMLKERGVAPFSKWEKELPKLVCDPRFKAIPSHSARRSLFEHHVKTRAEEERKEKRAAQKAAIEGFKQLLDEASEDIDATTDYHTFRKKWGNDARFEVLDRKDRESLLNERVLALKKAVEEMTRALRAASASSFKSLLREKGDVTTNSRWYRVKDNIRDDPRYRRVNHEDREMLFNEYIDELKAAQNREDLEAKAKRDEQDKLKERERELRKRKEREEQEMERVRLKIRRKEAVTSFQALLVEMIKDPQASWVESKAKLDKDPQGRTTNPDLDPSETEKLFREHIKMLQERCTQEFKALLSEVITLEAASSKETDDRKTVLNSWSTAKTLLKSDPRYTKMPRKDREALWQRHGEDLLKKLRSGEDNKREEKVSDPKGKLDSHSRRARDR
ncbi:hypothetical protein SAY87_006137 [Trapa incisa]|uniref:Pre-mRNA-processing protein 40C n=1 Tax=Trapa incisa TaxID=236973 RepID=A0AAN7K782_9MYRT|nr:hypothetical protein SAY87_006137 [Trapa incisa]